MRPAHLFKRALFGLEGKEVLDYMDRLLTVIEKQKSRSRQGGDNYEFLIGQMREDLEQEAQSLKRERARRRLLLLACPVLLLAALLVIGNLWFGMAEVTGDSMSPFLKAGDLVVYGRRKEVYDRGDLVVCDIDGTLIVKRAAAVPGDLVKMDGNGRVRIENARETLQVGTIENARGTLQVDTEEERLPSQVRLGEDEYFLLGDNRDMSVDSRDARIGPVERDRIAGPVVLVIRQIKRPDKK